jgi:hypothetical protein
MDHTGVRGANREIRTWAGLRWRHASGHPVSEKKGEVLARVLRAQTILQHGAIHRSGRKRREGIKGKEGEGLRWALLLLLVIIIQSSNLLSVPDVAPATTCASGKYNGIRALHADYANGPWGYFALCTLLRKAQTSVVDGQADTVTLADTGRSAEPAPPLEPNIIIVSGEWRFEPGHAKVAWGDKRDSPH